MKTVRDILEVKGRMVWSVDPGSTVFDALSLMAEKEIGALVVLDEARVAGIISERDYARKVILHGRASPTTRVEEIMTSPIRLNIGTRGSPLALAQAEIVRAALFQAWPDLAIEDAVILGRMLAEPFADVPSLLTAFGERRLPVCQFVQDGSRAVGEAGAVEDAASVARRNAAMPLTAQRQVDDFYTRLGELSR